MLEELVEAVDEVLLDESVFDVEVFELFPLVEVEKEAVEPDEEADLPLEEEALVSVLLELEAVPETLEEMLGWRQEVKRTIGARISKRLDGFIILFVRVF